MKVVFFGSTDFSLPIIQSIHRGFTIAGVVTSRPKPKGRGLKQSMPQIAVWAQGAGIPVHMPEDPNSEAFVNELTAIAPDLYVLSAYGHILRKKLLDVPRHGGINIHPSLLPQYRGAAPIQRAIMAGEQKTGITVISMDEEIDHGDILAQRSIPIEMDDTYGSLARKLADLGARMIPETLRAVASDTCQPVRQSGDVSYAPKLKKEEMKIDWREGARMTCNRIRALSPHPGARAVFRDKELIITRAQVVDQELPPGVLHVENRKLYVGAGEGSLVLLEVKPEGRRNIPVLDFINGYRVRKGETLR
ncbi:methionyl-tRNA formyltransferase [candidate division WOR-3 bacterium]|nr:methionyl-tRNA formyltransferase [candidate division WOR-3 bacterium]